MAGADLFPDSLDARDREFSDFAGAHEQVGQLLPLLCSPSYLRLLFPLHRERHVFDEQTAAGLRHLVGGAAEEERTRSVSRPVG